MKNKKKSLENENDNLTLLIIFFLFVIIIWSASWLILRDNKDRASFGDMFGGVNALFSGLALAGIIFTILLQKKELGLQRKELRDTRLEFETQNETMRKQRFENTFFQLLHLHHEIVEKLSFTSFGTNYYGRETFIKGYEEYTSHFNRETHIFINNDKGIMEKIEKDRTSEENEILYIRNAYGRFYKENNHNVLGHYFRNLYHIYKFIFLTEQIDLEQKQFYANIIRAQLSNAELNMLFYNCFVINSGYPKFKFLVDKFDVLQNIDTRDLLFEKHLSAFASLIINENPFEEEIKNKAYV